MESLDSPRQIPYFDYENLFSSKENELTTVILKVLRRGAFILQEELRHFEQSISNYLGVRFAVGMANCTDALTIGLRCAGIQPGDEVIFPSHTFVASPSAIHAVGAIPIPADCSNDHLIDPEHVRQLVTPRTRAIMPVHLNGRTCAMDAIEEIADKHELIIVEDAAQALGSSYKGKKAGTFGIASAFSFYPAKILGCFGDGGMMVTDNPRIAEKAFQMRDHGRDKNGKIRFFGVNSRLDNLQAAILNHQFETYSEIILYRRHLASIYQTNLQSVDQLTLPPGPDDDEKGHFDVFQNYELEADERTKLRQYLLHKGIGTLVQWGGQAIHQVSALRFKVSLPRTEQLFERALLLPINPMVSEEDVLYICQEIHKFYEQLKQ